MQVNTVTLPGGSPTTRLGFGCSSLAGGLSTRESDRLLRVAFDVGVRHFDVAPSYGLGSAESVLGSFLAQHKNSVTVTTKFGIPRPNPGRRAALQTARALLKPIVARLPGMKSRLLKVVQATGSGKIFGVRELQLSLEVSLRNLRCERINLFLLHEAAADDLTDDLHRVLEDSVARGLIGAWGFGSTRALIDRIFELRPAICSVLQFEWSILDERLPDYSGAFVITHRSLSSSYARMTQALSDPLRQRAWSEAVGVDLGDPRTLGRLMLASAFVANPYGIVLVSSKNSKRIQDNAAIMHGLQEEPVRRFMAAVAAERATLSLASPQSAFSG